MTVADSAKCVAYHFREKRKVIDYAFSKDGFDTAKRYTISLADRAAKTPVQKRIKGELTACASYRALINIVDRVIRNGEHTAFVNYD